MNIAALIAYEFVLFCLVLFFTKLLSDVIYEQSYREAIHTIHTILKQHNTSHDL